MNPWFAKGVVLAANVMMVVIRAPHGQRSRSVPVVKRCRGRQEFVLLAIAWIAFFLALVWIATPLLEFAEYPLQLAPLLAGAACLALGLWLFHRSHVDLGRNWSITLEVRDQHELVTHGLYRRVRHPMYLALLIFGLGQALALPNWLAGPSYGVAMLLLIAFRLPREEAMMREQFGAAWEEYTARTKRLIPGVW